MSTKCQEYSIETHGKKLFSRFNLRIGFNLDPSQFALFYFSVKHLLGKSELRNPYPQHSTCKGQGLEDSHQVARPRKEIGGSKACWARSNNGNLLTRGHAFFKSQFLTLCTIFLSTPL